MEILTKENNTTINNDNITEWSPLICSVIIRVKFVNHEYDYLLLLQTELDTTSHVIIHTKQNHPYL